MGDVLGVNLAVNTAESGNRFLHKHSRNLISIANIVCEPTLLGQNTCVCPGMRKYPVRYPRGDPVTRLLRFLSHWGYRTAARVAFPTWQTCTAIGITSDLPWSLFLQLGKGISRTYLEKDTRIIKGGVSRQLLWLHDVAISITLPLAVMSWFCPLNGIKWYNLLKIKALVKMTNHYSSEGTRESHHRVHELQYSGLGKPRSG